MLCALGSIPKTRSEGRRGAIYHSFTHTFTNIYLSIASYRSGTILTVKDASMIKTNIQSETIALMWY
jgi:hypothetical protein